MAKLALTTKISLIVLAIIQSAMAFAQNEADYPPVYTMSPKGVNLQTGRFVNSSTEFKVGPLSFVRDSGAGEAFMSRKQAGAVTPFGMWQHNHAMGIQSDGSNGVYAFINGTKLRFVKPSVNNPNGNWWNWNSAAFGWSLAEPNATTLVATNSNGDVYTFQAVTGSQTNNGFTQKSLTSIVFADGHRVDYGYNVDAQTRTVTSSRGYALVLDYDANGLLTTACGYNMANTTVTTASTCASATMKTSYGYTSANSDNYQLVSVTDVTGFVTTIGYADTSCTSNSVRCKLIASISLPGSSTLAIQNVYGPQPGEPTQETKPYQVRIQTTANGNTWLYRYEPNLTWVDAPPPIGQPILSYSFATYPTGENVEIEYDRGLARYVAGPTNTYAYTWNGMVPLTVTAAEGNKVTYTYDYANNPVTEVETPKPGSGLATKTVTRNFPASNIYGSPSVCTAASPKLCNKPISVVDAKGNQTDYTYDLTHGGVLTETLPAGANGVRPQTRYSYAPRTAWYKNSAGTFVAGTPIYVMTQKSICKAGAASGAGCATAADQVITVYDYGLDSGPNNLLLKGVVEDSGGLALRTCYIYDQFGRKISETKPLGTAATCPSGY